MTCGFCPRRLILKTHFILLVFATEAYDLRCVIGYLKRKALSLLIWALQNNQPSKTFLMMAMNESWPEILLQKYLVPRTTFPFRHHSTLFWLSKVRSLHSTGPPALQPVMSTARDYPHLCTYQVTGNGTQSRSR